MKKILLVIMIWVAMPSEGFGYMYHSWSGPRPMYYRQENHTWCVHACNQMLGIFLNQWHSVVNYCQRFRNMPLLPLDDPNPTLEAGVYMNEIASFTGLPFGELFITFNVADNYYANGSLPGMMVEAGSYGAHAMVVYAISQHYNPITWDGRNGNGFYEFRVHDPWYGPDMNSTFHYYTVQEIRACRYYFFCNF